MATFLEPLSLLIAFPVLHLTKLYRVTPSPLSARFFDPWRQESCSLASFGQSLNASLSFLRMWQEGRERVWGSCTSHGRPSPDGVRPPALTGDAKAGGFPVGKKGNLGRRRKKMSKVTEGGMLFGWEHPSLWMARIRDPAVLCPLEAHTCGADGGQRGLPGLSAHGRAGLGA